jgi:hypothetical protein
VSNTNIKQAQDIVAAYEAGELTGPGAEQAATEAVAILDAHRMAECVEAAYLRVTGGQKNQFVMLAALRTELVEEDRSAVDAALIGMQRAGVAVIYPCDDPQRLTKADHAASMKVCGERRDIFCIRP